MDTKQTIAGYEITCWSRESDLMQVNADGTLGADVEGEVEVARVVEKQTVKFENRGQPDEALLHLFIDRDGQLYVRFADWELCL